MSIRVEIVAEAIAEGLSLGKTEAISVVAARHGVATEDLRARIDRVELDAQAHPMTAEEMASLLDESVDDALVGMRESWARVEHAKSMGWLPVDTRNPYPQRS
jgi:hypothetical protein